MRRTTYILLPFLQCCLFNISTTNTFSQDAHYWSSAYGPAGYFVPGASISHNRDSGVLFYNPALLATTTQVSSSISGNVYQWNTILLKNGTGQGLDLRSRSTQIVPLVASHAVPYLKNKWPVTLAYAIVHTPVIHYRTSQRKDVSEYNVLTPGSGVFVRPDSLSNGNISFLKMKDARQAVLNAGFAVGYTFSSSLTMIASFRTDFNYADTSLFANEDGYQPNISSWNMYHAQIGANMQHKKHHVRAGLLFSYGSTSQQKQAVNFDNPREENFLVGDVQPVKAHSIQTGVAVSYIHHF